MAAKKVMVTGVYGLIPGAIYNRLVEAPDAYDVYALARRRHPSDRSPKGRVMNIADEKFFLSNLSDLNEVEKALDGIEVVVHMAADPRPEATWEQILSSNIMGSYNVFEASRRVGVKRILYASSVMFSWGYQADEPYKAIKEGRYDEVPDDFPIITHESPPRPTDPYSASKVWGEGTARYYSDIHGLSCICLRIGWVNAEDRPFTPDLRAVWCSQRDIVQLVEKSINAPDNVRFDILYGISNNKWSSVVKVSSSWLQTESTILVTGIPLIRFTTSLILCETVLTRKR